MIDAQGTSVEDYVIAEDDALRAGRKMDVNAGGKMNVGGRGRGAKCGPSLMAPAPVTEPMESGAAKQAHPASMAAASGRESLIGRMASSAIALSH